MLKAEPNYWGCNIQKGRAMFDEHVLYAISRDKVFSDSKKEVRFDFRKCCHEFGLVAITNS